MLWIIQCTALSIKCCNKCELVTNNKRWFYFHALLVNFLEIGFWVSWTFCLIQQGHMLHFSGEAQILQDWHFNLMKLYLRECFALGNKISYRLACRFEHGFFIFKSIVRHSSSSLRVSKESLCVFSTRVKEKSAKYNFNMCLPKIQSEFAFFFK